MGNGSVDVMFLSKVGAISSGVVVGVAGRQTYEDGGDILYFVALSRTCIFGDPRLGCVDCTLYIVGRLVVLVAHLVNSAGVSCGCHLSVKEGQLELIVVVQVLVLHIASK